ncbi:MAG: GNAT family protein [Hyphomicrobiales bacterium]
MSNFETPKPVEAEVLQGRTLRLEFLNESHFDGLSARVADKGELIFKNSPLGPSFKHYFSSAMAARKTNAHMPFVLVNKSDDAIIGMSRLFDIEPENASLEIGYTWYHPDFWGGATNPDAKLTFMTHVFEELGFNRVQLKTDERNAHSRAAMTKMGAQFEGILREHKRLPDGRLRSSAFFSVLKAEWPNVKAGLEARLTKLLP